MRRIAAGRTGLTIVFVWGFGEALMWPLIPDSALMALAFAVPLAVWRLWPATVAGSVAGGVSGVLLGRMGFVWPLPLVTERMNDAASGWMLDGAAGLVHQPFSGVPYKAFVAAGGSSDVDLIDFAIAVALIRGGRMLLFGLVGAAAGLILWRYVPDRLRVPVHVWVYATGAIGLFGGLALVINVWS